MGSKKTNKKVRKKRLTASKVILLVSSLCLQKRKKMWLNELIEITGGCLLGLILT